MQWPGGARCAVFLSFNFAAENLWLARDPGQGRRLSTMSMGRFGARIGVPAILSLLEEEGLKATFFVPGRTAEMHPAEAEAIVAGGHEIGHNGHAHLCPDPDRPDEVEAEVMQGLEVLQRSLGVRPAGYRAPAGETTGHLFSLLNREGFLYDSSLYDDIFPYRQVTEDGRPGQVELPLDPTLADISDVTRGGSPHPLLSREQAVALWQDSFQAMYQIGGLFTLALHPQVTGRPLRLWILKEFLDYTRGFGGVWYATGQEIAEAFAAQEEPAQVGEAGGTESEGQA
jgi:peptidoglycan-N-acetylglucosamine deacetylase